MALKDRDAAATRLRCCKALPADTKTKLEEAESCLVTPPVVFCAAAEAVNETELEPEAFFTTPLED